MRVLVTGATGFLGWRAAALLAERGPRRAWRSRGPGSAAARGSAELDPCAIDAGDPAARDLRRGLRRGAALRRRARSRGRAPRPGARGARERGHHAQPARGLRRARRRARSTPPASARRRTRRRTRTRCPSASARTPAASTRADATVVRLTSVFGPGQVAWEGATGAIAAFAARALERRADRDPRRSAPHARLPLRGRHGRRRWSQIVEQGRWNQTLTLASGLDTPLHRGGGAGPRDGRLVISDRDPGRGSCARRERELRHRRRARSSIPGPSTTP